MTRSEYAANTALESAALPPSGWATQSRRVYRKETAFARVLKAVFGRGKL